MSVFGRGKASAMRTWGEVSAPMPMVGIELNRNDLRREIDPRPWWKNVVSLFPNMQGGGLPTGNLYPVPLANQTDPRSFTMQNVRVLNPQPVILGGGSSTQATNVNMQNAMGSGQAALPNGSALPTFGNFG